MATKRAPQGLKRAGRALWTGTMESLDLEPHEAALLLEACRIADVLAELQETIVAEGALLDGPEGSEGSRPHPAVIEARLQRLAFARLLASLRFPDEDDARPQRRGGARGSYGRRSS